MTKNCVFCVLCYKTNFASRRTFVRLRVTEKQSFALFFAQFVYSASFFHAPEKELQKKLSFFLQLLY